MQTHIDTVMGMVTNVVVDTVLGVDMQVQMQLGMDRTDVDVDRDTGMESHG